MVRLVLVVMVLLIPLRGWSAERMCIQMAANQVAIELRSIHAPVAAMAQDCPMMANADATRQAPAAQDTSGSGCQSCQLCMPWAAAEHLAPNTGDSAPRAALPPVFMRYASAELARHAKPPIT